MFNSIPSYPPAAFKAVHTQWADASLTYRYMSFEQNSSAVL
jgi:hypothetical protein